MKYQSNNYIIIISPDFNDNLNESNIKILCDFKKIIFSNYKLDDNLFELYRNNNFNNTKIIKNKFNQPIDNLPSTITNLTFGSNFN